MVGQTVSHYKIVEKLGGGGMGVVYKAEDIKLDRFVALKFLPPTFSLEEEAKQRFIHEAKAASALDHSNICTVYEIGETEDGQLFISMAYYEGETLKEKIAKAQIEIDEVLNIALQICEGLAKAHQNNIVHRDIKPANIFITNDGIVKILDFGLAKTRGQTQLTQFGTTLGTIDYMSPEQTKGDAIDLRTDIWSLGVVLYEMLTGQLPFKGDYQQAVIYSILNVEPDLNEISNELAPIFNKAINKSAVHRYQTAKEMKIDLESLRDDSKDKKYFTPLRLIKFQRIRLIQIFTILIIFVLAGIYYFFFHGSHQVLPLKRTQLTFTGNVIRTEISPDGKSILYIDDSNYVFIKDINIGKPINILKGYSQIWAFRWAPDGTEIAIEVLENKIPCIILVNRFGSITRKIKIPGMFNSISWSPDGLSIVCFTVDMEYLYIINLATSSIKLTSALKDWLRWGGDFDLSSRGNLIAALTIDSLFLHQRLLTTSMDWKNHFIVVEDSIITKLRWNNKGDAIYYEKGKNQNIELMKVNVDSKKGEAIGSPELIKSDLQLYGLSFSNDNKRLVGTWGQSHTKIYSGIVVGVLDKDVKKQSILSGTFDLQNVKISPDGKLIAFTKEEQNGLDLFVMPFGGGEPTQLTFEDKVKNMAWSPDGNQIAFISSRSDTPKVCIINTIGGALKVLEKSKVSVNGQISWAPGRFILYQVPGLRNFYMHDPQNGTERLLVSNDNVGSMFSPQYSLKADKIAVLWYRLKVPGKASAGIWLLSPNDTLQIYLSTFSNGLPICWSEDGKNLLVLNYTDMSVENISIETGKVEKYLTLKNKNADIVDLDCINNKIVWIETETLSDVWLIENFDPDVE